MMTEGQCMEDKTESIICDLYLTDTMLVWLLTIEEGYGGWNAPHRRLDPPRPHQQRHAHNIYLKEEK